MITLFLYLKTFFCKHTVVNTKTIYGVHKSKRKKNKQVVYTKIISTCENCGKTSNIIL